MIKSPLLLAAVTSLAALVVRAAFFVGGVRGSDAYAYAQYAYQIATGTYDPNAVYDFYGFRYTVLLPTALAYRIFGVGDLPSVIFPYLFSSLHAGATFFLVDKLVGRREALIGAFLIIFYPLDVCMANILGPDTFIPFLATFALLLYLTGERTHSPVAYFFSGIFVGLAYLARVTSIFLFFALAFFHVLEKREMKHLGLITLGLIMPLAAESLYYYYLTGDFFLHYHRLSVFDHLVRGDNPDALVSLWFYPRVMFGFDLTGLALYGPLWWLVIFGLYYGWKKRLPSLSFLAITLIIPWLGFEFGRQNLRDMSPMMKNYNYLSLISGPAIAAAAYAVSSLLTGKREKVLLGIFLTFVATLNLYGAYRVMENVKDDALPYERAARFLREAEKRTVYVHHERWVLFLRYFLKYEASWDLKLIKDKPKEAEPFYLILHRRYLERDTAGRPMPPIPLARFWENPPPSWEKRLEFRGRPPYNTVVIYASTDIGNGK